MLGLGRTRLLVLAAAGVGTVLTMLLGLAAITAPDRAPLYQNLSLSSANAIQVALGGSGFDARISADGTEVSVPRSDLARARMVVAEMGMPIEGEPGWELFDSRNAMAMNSFMQRVNRLRAMEGELSRSIQTLDGVQSARVHLVMPDREPFSRNRPEPRASVIVRAAIGSAIEIKQAVAIRALVSSSVPELNPERVTVLSATGETILGESGPADVERPLQTMRTTIEDRLSRQVEEILSARVGAGNARVRVNVDLTTAREVVVEEIFDPEQQVVRSTDSRSERRDELDTSGNVGVENNIPAALQGEGGADAARSSQENNGESVEFEIGSTRREIVREAGEVQRVSVAVLVNGIYSVEDGDVTFTDRSPEELEQLTELVRTAVGYNEERGDSVSVASMRFMDYSMEVSEPIRMSIVDRISENIVSILRGLLGLFLVGLVLLLGVRPLLRQVETQEKPIATSVLEPPKNAGEAPLEEANQEPKSALPQTGLGEPSDRDPLPMPANMPGIANIYDPNVELPPNEYMETMGIHGRLTKARVDAIRTAADERPDQVLRVLRGWLSSEAEA